MKIFLFLAVHKSKMKTNRMDEACKDILKSSAVNNRLLLLWVRDKQLIVTNLDLCYIKLCRITSHSCSGMFVRAFWWSSSFSRCSKWLVKLLFWLMASMFSSSFDERSSDLIYSFSEINEERLSDGLKYGENFEIPSIKTKTWEK